MASGPRPTIPRPLSPWAQRFSYNVGGRFALIDDTEIHSGLATDGPRLHPKYYADTPPLVGRTPTRQQLDTIFTFESWQKSYLRGFESWQAGPLMRYVHFSSKSGLISGGHREEDYGPVPRSAAPAPVLAPAAGPANVDPANVDPANVDPANAMDVAMDVEGDVVDELKEDAAIKIFHSERIQVDESKWYPFLKKERWYDTVGPDQSIGGGNWSVDNPKIWEVLSISIELLDRMIKALVADKHTWMETMLYGLLAPWERLTTVPAPYPNAIVLLSQPYYKEICDLHKVPCSIDFITQFTPEEYTARLVYLMKHQTWGFTERYDDNEGTWGVTIHKLRATFVDFDGACEMGFAAEQRIFGGQIFLGPRTCKDIPFGVYRMEWPDPQRPTDDGFTDPTHEIFQPGSYIYTDRIPALHVSKLLSTEFWEDPAIDRKSENAFHFEPIIANETKWAGPGTFVLYHPSALVTPLPDWLLPGEMNMIQAWGERNYEWQLRRQSWHLQELLPWTGTPWAQVRYRQEILAFARAFARKDELDCRYTAEKFIDRIPMNEGKQKYIDLLPPTNIFPHEWIFHAIAALPIRNYTLTNTDETSMVITLLPSREAKALSIRTDSIPSRLKDDRYVDESELYDPLGRPEAGKIADFGQEDYLNLVTNLLNHIGSSGTRIPAPWLREITRTLEDLRIQRRDIRRGTRDRSTWATAWKFIIPAYTATMSQFIDGQWTTIIP
ncbi:hypothetical protein E0Z10_g500 [Xylaria hypoxylon]|uniref:Uncharacterized protein n=1 Tax=Xylaria hypoxylon TaxID=37992 RepID=A0A4Z0Z7S9_9PEZI|nr:hypothetical protein E0Z10_g500 [Xylaria hypoxylon]